MVKEKPRKPRLVIITDEMYRTQVAIMVGDEIAALWEQIKDFVAEGETQEDLKRLLAFPSDTTAGFTVQLEGGKVIIRLHEELAGWPVLNHELIHAAKMILSSRGIKTSSTLDESLPYYVQFLSQRIVDAGGIP